MKVYTPYVVRDRPYVPTPLRDLILAGFPEAFVELGQKHGAPILPAYRDSRTLRVFCRHCPSATTVGWWRGWRGRWHYHGAGEHVGDGDGHRCQHCDHARPEYPPVGAETYLSTGYVLVEVGPLTPEIERLALQARRALHAVWAQQRQR